MQLYSERHLVQQIQVSRSTIRRWIAAGDFPQPIKLGPRRVAWRESDVSAWLATKN